MSYKSYFRRAVGKKHTYETQADLKDMSREAILRIDPKDIGTYVETETGGIPLTGDKKKGVDAVISY